MPGVVFLVVIPTASFERGIYGVESVTQSPSVFPSVNPNNLNINQPENLNAKLRLEVQLREKHAVKTRRGRGGRIPVAVTGARRPIAEKPELKEKQIFPSDFVPLEQVLEELLMKLEIEHVTWTTDKKNYCHQVIFPLQSGEPCETTLHCLTQLGIGTKLHSNVNVIPCSVTYDALNDFEDFSEDSNYEENTKWKAFVESIKSKLTVKQVVEGVRSGGSMSFDYLLLIVTADALAALGLIENNAPNIVAAMLVSPLMGPVMSITFGTIISDRDLMRVGFVTLATGMLISLLFGFIFGLLLGTTEFPWGSGNWPTEEMSGRGNVRALWMGVLWALTSGTGVAVALLQGSAGPLIGVAISASLLPPMVNGGIFWALACTWKMNPNIRMPYIKGEPLAVNYTSSYEFLYTDYLPTEFFINGIVSCCLTIVNIVCIFITAVIVLKIKEVSAPYTASPDLKRFWETDLRTVRKINRESTMRKMRGGASDKFQSNYQELEEPRNRQLDTVLEQAISEATDDVTFKKVKRMSYSSNAAGELTNRLARIMGLKHGDNSEKFGALNSQPNSRMNSFRNSKLQVDLKALDKIVTSLLEQQNGNGKATGSHFELPQSMSRKSSFKLNRFRPTSRSAHSLQSEESGNNLGVFQDSQLLNNKTMTMPTIMESSIYKPLSQSAHPSSSDTIEEQQFDENTSTYTNEGFQS